MQNIQNPKKSDIFTEILGLSIVRSKWGHEYKRIFKEKDISLNK